MSALGGYSSDDAREEAEYHRQELTETLDALGNKLNRTLSEAEAQINKPRNWIRESPWVAIALGLAAGYLVARPRRKTSRHSALVHELETAYLEGRRDEIGHFPVRDKAYWQDRGLVVPESRPAPATGNLLLRVVEPVAKVAAEVLTRALTGI